MQVSGTDLHDMKFLRKILRQLEYIHNIDLVLGKTRLRQISGVRTKEEIIGGPEQFSWRLKFRYSLFGYFCWHLK